MPAAIPSPVVAFTKLKVHVAPWVDHYIDETLQYVGLMAPHTDQWRHLHCRFHWSGSTDVHDDMICTMNWSNITAGVIDSSWTTADYTNLEGKLDTFWTAIAGSQANVISMVEYRWYKRAYNDLSSAEPFAPFGPPERVTPRSSIVGGSAQVPVPPQAAISVTLKTPYPRNWGRFYIPGAASGLTVAGGIGKIGTAHVDAIANATQTLVSTAAASDFQLVVPLTSLGTGKRGTDTPGTPHRALVQTSQIQVDNNWDVIRRRRLHTTTYRKDLP